MYLEAIDNNHYDWLKYLWAFKKNYIGNRRNYNTDLGKKEKVEKVDFERLFYYINLLS